MITFPVKTKRDNAPVSPLFGKAKYFAFFDGDNLDIEENPFDNGSDIIDWLRQKGVTDVIIKEMGLNPYKKLKQTNMNIFYSGDGRVTSNEVIEKYKEGNLENLNENRILEIIKNHESSHNHDHGEHHHH